MSLRNLMRALLICAAMLLSWIPVRAQRQMESLGRGVVAIKRDDGKIFVSWRLLATDPQNLAFNLYRVAEGATTKLNTQPITGATNFIDGNAILEQMNAYFVRPISNGKEQAPSASFVIPAKSAARPYLSLPLRTPDGYAPNDASVGDLDGDGEYEIVLHQAGRGKDNSQSGITDPPILQAYKLDGTLLWTINLGHNIREGAHYTQFMVYDLDGDGRAEIVCKTADGTTDGKGSIIGDAKANYVSEKGYILSGPEYLTVFNGLTGAALATTNYIPSRMPDDPTNLKPTSDQIKKVWGDGYGNRPDRFLACIAYLDGVHPSVVMSRGYYTRTFLAAWDFRGGKITSRWVFDSNTPGNEKYAGQGNHNLSVADVDGDGKDEIIYGAMALDDNGKGLYSTELGHGDAIHLSDLDPKRPGLEVFRIQEPYADAGMHMFDAKTGEILWKIPPGKAGGDGEGPGRGLALDIDPRHEGFECWGAGAQMFGKVFDAKGNLIDTNGKAPPVNMGVYWDGDLLSETLDGTTIGKWDWLNNQTNALLDAKQFDCVSNNGTKANPCLSADILGDWREEVIWRTADNKELRIFTTTEPTQHRFVTFMHDPEYRLSIAWQNVGYNQPPHTSFYIGPNMKNPPQIVITTAPKSSFHFAFDPAAEQTGATLVTSGTTYSTQTGYGFENATDKNQLPKYFSVALPEGNYQVTLRMGAEKTPTDTTVKAEARRLMLEGVRTAPGEFVESSFAVNVRTPRLAAGGEVRLKARETGVRHWDDKLTLEFNGARPGVQSLSIVPLENAVTVYLAGDSTVTDQPEEPWSSWGQMLPRFFNAQVAVANYAESGETLNSFRSARRQEKILENIKAGDYLFIQFGHNDQKDKAPGAGPFTSYKANLKQFVEAARAKNALPVLVTPMERRRFEGDKPTTTLADFAEAVRQVGSEEKVPVIDLNGMSLKFYAALGPEGSKAAFVHYAANTFPGQDKALRDDTHFNAYGGYELAKSVVEGIKTRVPALGKYLQDDVKPFDPAHPDAANDFHLPTSALTPSTKPDGS